MKQVVPSPVPLHPGLHPLSPGSQAASSLGSRHAPCPLWCILFRTNQLCLPCSKVCTGSSDAQSKSQSPPRDPQGTTRPASPPLSDLLTGLPPSPLLLCSSRTGPHGPTGILTAFPPCSLCTWWPLCSERPPHRYTRGLLHYLTCSLSLNVTSSKKSSQII